MVIERIRVSGLSAPPGYSHAVVAQTRQVLANLALALESAGASEADVLKTTVYVVSENREDLAAVWRVVQESDVAGAASTLLGVSLLGYEGQLVEIEALAALE